MRIIYESKHYAVIDCKQIATQPLSGDNIVQKALGAWCSFYEELLDKGYRPLHRIDHRMADAVLCEKMDSTSTHGKNPKAA